MNFWASKLVYHQSIIIILCLHDLVKQQLVVADVTSIWCQLKQYEMAFEWLKKHSYETGSGPRTELKMNGKEKLDQSTTRKSGKLLLKITFQVINFWSNYQTSLAHLKINRRRCLSIFSRQLLTAFFLSTICYELVACFFSSRVLTVRMMMKLKTDSNDLFSFKDTQWW